MKNINIYKKSENLKLFEIIQRNFIDLDKQDYNNLPICATYNSNCYLKMKQAIFRLFVIKI